MFSVLREELNILYEPCCGKFLAETLFCFVRFLKKSQKVFSVLAVK